MKTHIHTLVLGTRDPEMDAIGRVALAEQLNVVWACKQGRPVQYGDMYRATEPAATHPHYLWVECSPPDGKSSIDFVDHHQPGDPGFGQPPEKFWSSSSLGQVWNRLCPDTRPPEPLLVIAAADHCPHAAYAGECPGVDPGSVVAFSAEQISLTTGQPIKAILQAIYQRIHKFRLGDTEAVAGARVYVRSQGQPLTPHEWLVLREAGLWHGVAVAASVVDSTGVWFRLAGSPNAGLVEAFMGGQIVPNLTDVYGDPQRGYAGGRLS